MDIDVGEHARHAGIAELPEVQGGWQVGEGFPDASLEVVVAMHPGAGSAGQGGDLQLLDCKHTQGHTL